VLNAGKPVLSEDLLHLHNRSGFIEERYYTVSFTPIVLESATSLALSALRRTRQIGRWANDAFGLFEISQFVALMQPDLRMLAGLRLT